MAATVPAFLCDEMLKGLGRWLRAAGYDTLILDDGLGDAALLARARAEGRLLLTRDRQLLEHRGAAGQVVLLECTNMEDCARALTARLGLDWLRAPFSRCRICNTPLYEADPAQRLRVPADARHDRLLLYCPKCDKLYWEGSHVRRMRAHLQRWAAGQFRP